MGAIDLHTAQHAIHPVAESRLTVLSVDRRCAPFTGSRFVIRGLDYCIQTHSRFVIREHNCGSDVENKPRCARLGLARKSFTDS